MTTERLSLGSNVRCIDVEWNLTQQPSLESCKLPVVGNTYTVREVLHGVQDTLGIRLLEIANPEVEYEGGIKQEPVFAARHFELLPDATAAWDPS